MTAFYLVRAVPPAAEPPLPCTCWAELLPCSCVDVAMCLCKCLCLCWCGRVPVPVPVLVRPYACTCVGAAMCLCLCWCSDVSVAMRLHAHNHLSGCLGRNRLVHACLHTAQHPCTLPCWCGPCPERILPISWLPQKSGFGLVLACALQELESLAQLVRTANLSFATPQRGSLNQGPFGGSPFFQDSTMGGMGGSVFDDMHREMGGMLGGLMAGGMHSIMQQVRGSACARCVHACESKVVRGTFGEATCLFCLPSALQ